MDREHVESSMLCSVGYDPAEAVLEVEFARGKVYQYAGVPAEVYESLMGADSIGKAFSSLVKSQGYAYRQV